MLHLLCDNIVKIEELKEIFKNKGVLDTIKRMIRTNSFYTHWRQLDNFYQTAFTYFDRVNALRTRERIKELKKLKEAIDDSDLNELIKRMGGDPRAAQNSDPAEFLKLLNHLLETKRDT